MKVPEGRIVRPTLRCLLDDLANEVGPPELRACVPTARRDMAADRRFLFPVALAATQHLVLDRANLLALDSNSDREPIVSITDRSIIKVKTSDRRGALWFDGETWWLLAAGRRKDDGPGDFYRDLEKYGRNSDPIAPTEADRVYLRYETAFLAECAAERDAQMAVVQAVLTATANPGTVETVEVFGAHVAVLIDAEADDEMLSVSFDFVNFQQRDRFPVDVLQPSPRPS